MKWADVHAAVRRAASAERERERQREGAQSSSASTQTRTKRLQRSFIQITRGLITWIYKRGHLQMFPWSRGSERWAARRRSSATLGGTNPMVPIGTGSCKSTGQYLKPPCVRVRAGGLWVGTWVEWGECWKGRSSSRRVKYWLMRALLKICR